MSEPCPTAPPSPTPIDVDRLRRQLAVFLGDDADPDAAGALEMLLGRKIPSLVDRLAAVERERDAAMNERDAAELMVRRLADQAVSDEARIAAVDAERDRAVEWSMEWERQCAENFANYIASESRIAAVEAAADEVHGHGADDERAEVERLRGIISRIAALAASPTPSRNDPHAWDGNETCRCGRGRYSALHGMFDLAASPTPTGPEPAKYEYCPHGWTRAHCGSCHDEVYGPATPTEPTEETP